MVLVCFSTVSLYCHNCCNAGSQPHPKSTIEGPPDPYRHRFWPSCVLWNIHRICKELYIVHSGKKSPILHTNNPHLFKEVLAGWNTQRSLQYLILTKNWGKSQRVVSLPQRLLGSSDTGSCYCSSVMLYPSTARAFLMPESVSHNPPKVCGAYCEANNISPCKTTFSMFILVSSSHMTGSQRDECDSYGYLIWVASFVFDGFLIMEHDWVESHYLSVGLLSQVSTKRSMKITCRSPTDRQ